MCYVICPAAIDLFSPANIAGYLSTAIVAILGFLITWFLLKKLLYKPIMKISDARAQMVQAGMEANAEEEARLAKLEKDFQDRKAQYLAEEANHKKQAEEQLQLERANVLREAHDKAANILSKAEKTAKRREREQEANYRRQVADMSVKLLSVLLQDDKAAQGKTDDIKKLVDTMIEDKE